MPQLSRRKKLFYLIVTGSLISMCLYGCAEHGKPSPKTSNPPLTAAPVPGSPKPSAETPTDLDGAAPSFDPMSLADEEDSNIEYLPLIPVGDEVCNTETPEPETDPAVIEIQGRLDEALDFYEASQDFWQQGELDNALQTLDQAYALITGIDTMDHPKLIQQKDDLRFMISKRILEIYTSRHITAKGDYNAIPLIMNTDVQKEIDLLMAQNDCRSFFEEAYKRSGKYRPYILNELRKAGLPEELSWLPLIESGFKVNALSSARALGLWQFIASTGHKFGLNRNRYIDERLDPYKATQAAIGYLKELHEIFGDWLTVLAAYNCGENRVLSTIRDQNVNYLDDFWDLYQRLPNETARYVPKFLATLHIINNLEKYNLQHLGLDDPMEFEIQTISKQAYLKNIAEAISVPEQTLLDLNPELRYKLLPPETYPLKVPPGTKEILIADIDKISAPVAQAQAESKPGPGLVYHRVRPGETLFIIASRYNTTVKDIARYNNIHKKNYITTGHILKIPRSGQFAEIGESGEAKTITYHVRSGDSLWTLAKRYDTTTWKIKKLNQLGKATRLTVGQILKIQAGPQYGLKLYRVKNGNSLSRIANKNHMSLDQLLRLNHLTQNSTIYQGQELFVE